MSWRSNFNTRELNEIQFSRVYLEQYNHGTDGHNAKIIMAKMASLLDKVEKEVNGYIQDMETVDPFLINHEKILQKIVNLFETTKEGKHESD